MALSGEKGTVGVVIAESASLSSAVELPTATLLGFIMPSAWTAADVTYQGSNDGTTWYDLHSDTAGEITSTVTAGKLISVYGYDFAACKWLRLRSGTSATPVAQVAARTITLIVGEA